MSKDYLGRLERLKQKAEIADKESLNKQEDLERREKFREARKMYRDISKKGKDRKIDREYVRELLDSDPEERRTEISATAHYLMDEKYLSPQWALKGALLYEKIGKGRKAVPKLLKDIEERTDKKILYGLDETFIESVEKFVERNPRKRQQTEGGIEGRTLTGFVSVLAGAVGLIMVASNIGGNITGNAVSNVTGTTSGLFGVLLFIVGLVGSFFYFKRK